MLFFFGSLWSFPVIENTVWWVTKDCVLPILYILRSIFDFQPGRIRAVGIVGIERKLEEKRKETDKNISEVTYRSSGHLSFSAIYVYSFG